MSVPLKPRRLAAIPVVFALLAVLLAPLAQSETRPNVIFIVTDDQGYGDMACHGNPWLKTPNLDRLHRESATLEDYHVDPVCTPTRAALMTGRYSVRVGAWAVTEGRQLLNPDEKTMGDVFSASGYRTGMFGKWHLGDAFPYGPEFRGFQDVVRHRAGGVDEIGNPIENDYFDDIYYRNGKPEKFEGYCTDVWFGEALRFIRQDRSSPDAKPFFVYLPLNAMHGPHNVAEKYSAPYAAQGIPKSRAAFYGMVANFDENLGRLFDTLQETGLERDTIVIFMGDNGTGGGLQGNDGFNAGMRDKKGSIYEGGHRVACFARWPAGFKAGARIEQLTTHHDWLPTLIDVCGLEAPEGVAFDGRSIAPLLTGSATELPERTVFVDRQADQLEKAPLARSATGPYPQFAVLTERWRMANGELYAIQDDPGQATNVASKYPEVAKRLYEEYERHYDDVSRGSEYARFLIGSPQQNPTAFTVRDWHPTEGNVVWKQVQTGDDSLFINGFWAVDIVRDGRYAVRLSRFPQDAEKPMGANSVRLKLGDLDQRKATQASDASATFELDLKKGPALLQAWMKDAATEKARGAYYVQVTRLGD